MLNKIVVCFALAFWAYKRQAVLLPSLIYAALNWWAASMYQMAGGQANIPVQVLIAAVMSYVLFWLTAKTSGRWFGIVAMLLTWALLFLYPFNAGPISGGKWIDTSSGKEVFLPQSELDRIDAALKP